MTDRVRPVWLVTLTGWRKLSILRMTIGDIGVQSLIKIPDYL